MPKVLGQAGISLSDVYDVEGSIVGVENLMSEDVSLVHEMGSTIFSERLIANIERLTTGAILQTITFNITQLMPVNVYRIMGIYVQTDVASRLDHVQVSIRSSRSGREMPLFIWAVGGDGQVAINIVENGEAVSVDTALIMDHPIPNMPSMGVSFDQPIQNQVGDEIVMRGLTGTFGAGDVTVTALLHVVQPSASSSLSSLGLPIPGW